MIITQNCCGLLRVLRSFLNLRLFDLFVLAYSFRVAMIVRLVCLILLKRTRGLGKHLTSTCSHRFWRTTAITVLVSRYLPSRWAPLTVPFFFNDDWLLWNILVLNVQVNLCSLYELIVSSLGCCQLAPEMRWWHWTGTRFVQQVCTAFDLSLFFFWFYLCSLNLSRIVTLIVLNWESFNWVVFDPWALRLCREAPCLLV